MKFEFSAGGVVYRKQKDRTYILVARHSGHHGWVFPKGLIGDHIKGEGKEETALREVEEETGVKGKIIKPLEPVEYWYNWGDEKRKKKVYYFLMGYMGEDMSKRDDEMEEVEFIPQEEVEERLTYPSDKKVWKEAQKELLTIDK